MFMDNVFRNGMYERCVDNPQVTESVLYVSEYSFPAFAVEAIRVVTNFITFCTATSLSDQNWPQVAEGKALFTPKHSVHARKS